MLRRAVLSFALVQLSSIPAALAQTPDEWSSFPPLPAAGTQPAAKPSPPAPPSTQPASAQPALAVPASGVPALVAPESDEGGQVISTSERFLPGTEPHSPSTWGNAYNARENLRVGVGAAGIGVLDVSSADLGGKGLLRFYALGEYLNQGNFPVLGATNVRTTGTFGLSFVPIENVEAYLSYTASANSNSRTSPVLIQSLGDVTLGAKYARRWAKGFDGGLDLRLQSYSGVGNQSISRYAFGFAPRLVGTYDLREPLPAVPLRLHANVGMLLDGTGGLVKTFSLNTSEEFALGVNRYHRLAVGAALEAPLPAVTPFLEYQVGYPLGVANGQLVAPDGAVISVASAMAQTLSLGMKVTAVKDLTLGAAVNFGLARFVGSGVPATPPFDFRFAASFNVDPFGRGETRFVETLRERKVETVQAAAPTTGKISGTVIDASTRKPIAGVIVAIGRAGLPPVASDAEAGRFLTHELAGGPVKLSFQKEGYKSAEQELTLEAGQLATLEAVLEASVRRAVFELTVVSKKKAIAAAVVFKGPIEQRALTAEGASAPVSTELPGGRYLVNVTAEGFLSQTREVQVSDGAKMPLAFDLVPEPKKKLAVLKENKIEVSQQVHFATGKDTILGDSFSLLQQVVDVIVKGGVKKMRVEGHTDNKGQKAANQRLSEARAKAVADFLVQQGIDRSRIESAGFGDTKPVAPNLTVRGRELNRRVDFVVLER